MGLGSRFLRCAVGSGVSLLLGVWFRVPVGIRVPCFGISGPILVQGGFPCFGLGFRVQEGSWLQP